MNQEIVPQVAQKSSRIRKNYNELRLELEGDYAVVFRAFNEGSLIGSRLRCRREVKVMAKKSL